MRFTAKRRFNDSKIYNEKMKKKMREQMQKDAEAYRDKKMEVGKVLEKADLEKDRKEKGGQKGGFMNKFGRDVFEHAGKEGIEGRINRGKYFMDSGVASRDDYNV